MAGELDLSVRTNKAWYPATGAQQLAYVLIEARPTEEVKQVKMPLNLSLVLDHSGSMSGAKLDNLKSAARLAISQMSPQDLVSLIVFDDKVKVAVHSQPVSDPGALTRVIDEMRAGGGTKMSLGMQEGLQELRKGLAATRVSRMVLLTDGETFGDTDVCVKLAREAGQTGIPITALGLGEDWKQALLDEVAQASGGISDYVPDGEPDSILATFENQVQTAQGTVVQNANLLLRLVPGAVPRAVWRVTPLITKLDHRALSERDVQVALGSMDSKQGQSVLVELLLPPRQPGRYRAAQAEVSYDVPISGVTGEIARTDVVVGFSEDPAQSDPSDPEVMNTVEKVTAHRLQTRALEEAAVGNIVGATQKLRAAATRLLDLGEEELAETAAEEAARLERGEGLSSAGTKVLHYQTRKLTQQSLEDED